MIGVTLQLKTKLNLAESRHYVAAIEPLATNIKHSIL